MRVLLTGASGFVGSSLADVFRRRGADVVAPSHAELDLTDRDAQLARLHHELEEAACATT